MLRMFSTKKLLLSLLLPLLGPPLPGVLPAAVLPAVAAATRISPGQLVAAAAAGNEAAVRELFAAGADVHAANEWGDTALHEASREGHAVVVEVLLAEGGDVDVKDGGGWTPLHVASGRGHAALVERLLAAGADVHATTDGGDTPRHYAKTFGHADVVEMLLLAEEADVHAKIDGGAGGVEVLDGAPANDYVDTSTEGDHPLLLSAHPHSQDSNSDGQNQEGGEEAYCDIGESRREVVGWLLHRLPKLRRDDAVKYRDSLIENGFDSTEVLNLLGEGQLHFMKEGHRMMLLEKLSESRSD